MDIQKVIIKPYVNKLCLCCGEVKKDINYNITAEIIYERNVAICDKCQNKPMMYCKNCNEEYIPFYTDTYQVCGAFCENRFVELLDLKNDVKNIKDTLTALQDILKYPNTNKKGWLW